MVDPLSVKCPACGANPRGRCMSNPGAYRHLLKFRPPHAARVRAAERQEKPNTMPLNPADGEWKP